MLSMTPLKNAQAAKSYYEKDNYYIKDSKEAIALSHWWGKGAKALNLSGYVHLAEFEKLLEGTLPTGEQLGRHTSKGKKHRPGYDLTFSAPKSFSILAEIGGDRRLNAIHAMAVEEALSYLEKTAIKTRVFKEGEIVFEKVDNMAMALFHHDTSREMDPSTHTHCVLLNMVQRNDGKWRSVSSESIYDHKMVTGLIYRSRLAVELQRLGYEINKTHSDGRFEIVGVPENVIKHFSKRRQQIEERLKEEGWEGAKASEKVALDTRRRKQDAERGDLQNQWLKDCAVLQFNPTAIIEASKNKITEKQFELNDPSAVAKDAILYATAHLGEREAVFSKRDLIRESLAHALGCTTITHVEDAILQISQTDHLMTVSNDHFTTLAALNLEENVIELMKAGQGQCVATSDVEKVRAFIAAREQNAGLSYTKGQLSAIEMILTTTDKVVGIQGSAGSGKTTFLQTIKTFAENEGYSLIGIAPTKNAAVELQSKTDIISTTLQKYLMDSQNKTRSLSENKDKPQLLILDEASMVSSRQMFELMQSVKDSDLRLVMIGDTKQLSAIDAGKPFAQLQCAGMHTVRMSEILRQKNAMLKEAVQDAMSGDIAAAFQKINISEVPHKDQRLQRVVDEYLGYSENARERVLVLVPANEDRILVNAKIRTGLQKEGQLHGEEIKTESLVSRGFSKTYRTRVTNYQVGDVVRFNKTYRNLGVRSGEYLRVNSINREQNEMILENSTGHKKLSWNPEKVGGRRDGAIEVYQLAERTLMAGDKIRWLRNNGNAFINAQTAEILRIDGKQAEVLLHNKQKVMLNLDEPGNKHWDYAFSYTLHAKQGGENISVIAHMESFRTKLSTQQAFYVTISRAEYDVRLIVDNREDCIATVSKYTGEKSSAMEAVGKMQDWNDTFKNDQKPEFRGSSQHINGSYPHTTTKITTTSPTPHWDIQGLQTRLADKAEMLAIHLLGEPNPKLSSRKELRFGKKGSLWVPIVGKHVGGWRDFESGAKGNLIQLIQHVTQSSFKGALGHAGQFLGIHPDQATSPANIPHKAMSKNYKQIIALDAEDKKAISRAVLLEKQSRPIQGTLAERYLREQRGIQGSIPDCFRYHPQIAYYSKTQKKTVYFPALVAVARDAQQKTLAVQVVYLDPKTAQKASIDIPKRTYGRPSLGAAVTINPGQGKILLAEGPETGLSVAEACPNDTVLVTLSASNFSNIKLTKEQKEVIICMDNDGDNASSRKAVTEAANIHTQRGHHVFLAIPDEIGQDFNDVLKLEGVAAIHAKIDKAIPYQLDTLETTRDDVLLKAENSQLTSWIETEKQQQESHLMNIASMIDAQVDRKNDNLNDIAEYLSYPSEKDRDIEKNKHSQEESSIDL